MDSSSLIIIAVLLVVIVLLVFKDKLFKKNKNDTPSGDITEKTTTATERIASEIKENIIKKINPVEIPKKQTISKGDGETIRTSVMSILQTSRVEGKEPYVLPISSKDFVDDKGNAKCLYISHPGAKASGMCLYAPHNVFGKYDTNDIDVYSAMTVNTHAISIHRRYDDNNRPRYFCRVDNKDAVVFRTVNYETPEQIFPGEYFEIHNGLKVCVGEQWLIFVFAVAPSIPNNTGKTAVSDKVPEIPSLGNEKNKFKFRPDSYEKDPDDIPEIPVTEDENNSVKIYHPTKKTNDNKNGDRPDIKLPPR